MNTDTKVDLSFHTEVTPTSLHWSYNNHSRFARIASADGESKIGQHTGAESNNNYSICLHWTALLTTSHIQHFRPLLLLLQRDTHAHIDPCSFLFVFLTSTRPSCVSLAAARFFFSFQTLEFAFQSFLSISYRLRPAEPLAPCLRLRGPVSLEVAAAPDERGTPLSWDGEPQPGR